MHWCKFWCCLWFRIGLFTAARRMQFLCRSKFLQVAPVTMKFVCWLMETVNMRQDDTGNVCVSESPGVPGNQTCPWPQMIAPQSLCCKPSPAYQILVALFSPPAFISLSSVLIFWFCIFFPFPFPHLSLRHPRSRAVVAWENNSLVLSNQVCFATSNASPLGLLLELISSCFVSNLFFSFKAMSTLRQLRDVHHWLSRVPYHAHTHLEWKATWECLLICALTQNH